MRNALQVLIVCLGVAFVVGGVALWSIPAAMIVTGVVLLSLAYAWRYLTVRMGTDDR